MDAIKSEGVNKGILAMRAAWAALTPEQRQERKDAAAARRAAMPPKPASTGKGGPFPTGANRAPQPPAARPPSLLPDRTWRVCVVHEPQAGILATHVCEVSAPTMRKAGKLARAAAVRAGIAAQSVSACCREDSPAFALLTPAA